MYIYQHNILNHDQVYMFQCHKSVVSLIRKEVLHIRSIAASATTTCTAINIPASWLLGTTLCVYVYSSLSV